MAKTLQIGTKIFTIPDAGETPGWGEDTTAFFEAIAEALETVQGPNDILLTQATLTNNQTVATNIPGLLINLIGDVKGALVDYAIERIYDSGASTLAEYGQILCSYDGSVFTISTDSNDDTGVVIDADNTGQFTYTSSNLANHVSSVIRFRVKTIDG